eukprot:9890156-Karenia_brevis.AAC.1
MNAILFGAAPLMAGSVSGPWTSTFSNALGNNLVQLGPGSFMECALTDPVSGQQVNAVFKVVSCYVGVYN